MCVVGDICSTSSLSAPPTSQIICAHPSPPKALRAIYVTQDLFVKAQTPANKHTTTLQHARGTVPQTQLTPPRRPSASTSLQEDFKVNRLHPDISTHTMHPLIA
jgi:hypothetical protein